MVNAPDFVTMTGTSVNEMVALIQAQQATIVSQQAEIGALKEFVGMMPPSLPSLPPPSPHSPPALVKLNNLGFSEAWPVGANNDAGNNDWMTYGGGPSKCFDDLFTDSCFAHGSNVWVSINFNRTVSITSVEVYNRASCCQDRLGHYQIWVGDSWGARTAPAKKCAERHAPSTVGPFTDECIATGQFLTLLQPGSTRAINLQEISIYGYA